MKLQFRSSAAPNRDAARVLPPAMPASASRRGWFGYGLGLAGVLVFGPTGVLAHSRLVKSDPSARAILGTAPKEVHLWFNEPIEPAFAKTWLARTDGTRVDLANHGDPADKQALIATLPENIPDGPVVIAFRVLSVDGHVIESQLTFTVKKSA